MNAIDQTVNILNQKPLVRCCCTDWLIECTKFNLFYGNVLDYRGEKKKSNIYLGPGV